MGTSHGREERVRRQRVRVLTGGGEQECTGVKDVGVVYKGWCGYVKRGYAKVCKV